MSSKSRILLVAAALGSALTACAGEASDASSSKPENSGRGGSDPGTGAGPGGQTPGIPPAPGPTNPPTPPPETEVRQDFEIPRGGGRYVYVANRRRDSVAVIDSTQLSIRTVTVGDTPTSLATVEGQDVALVINSGSKDVHILRTDPAGITTATRVPVVGGANRISVAPGGRHAVVWFDSSAPAAGAPVGGSFQEASVIALGSTDTSFDLTVGFRPTDVVFSSDGMGAFIVTEDGISVVRFAELKMAMVAPFVRLPDAGAAAAPVRDVSVTPDGRFAIARREGSPLVLLLDLAASTSAAAVQTLDLGSPATDLDLAPSGGFALAVLRAENAFVRIAVPAGFAPGAAIDKRLLPGENVGSAVLSADGARAVLYTTAASPPVERLVVVDLAGQSPPLPVTLKKSVRTVAISPDGKAAIVLHNKVAGDPRELNIDVETQIDRHYGYTVVNLATGFPKLQITSADVTSLAITPDGSRAFVLLPGPRAAQRITLASFIVDEFPLGSPPVALAVLGQAVKRVFVSQEHPEGRISFINWETGVVESVTGFELNGRIVQ
jgi:YVTN family beta-propeller protein